MTRLREIRADAEGEGPGGDELVRIFQRDAAGRNELDLRQGSLGRA
jgi:hypothetical protein